MSLQNYPEVSDESPTKLPACDDRVECPQCGEYPAYEIEHATGRSYACKNCKMGGKYFQTHATYGRSWERVREWIIERDEGACRRCRTEDDLHVHHIKRLIWFDSLSEAHRPENLLTLCEDCHREVERWPKERVYDRFGHRRQT